jgi:hypothetical protein
MKVNTQWVFSLTFLKLSIQSTLKFFLIKKLQHYGIKGICLQWFKDYLQERTQIVKYKQHRSTEMNAILQESHSVQFLVHCYFFYTSTTSKAVVIYFRSYYMQMIRMLSIQIRAWKLCIIQCKMKWIRLWNGSMPINYQSTLLRQNL